jgi:uncharacterized protein HemX
MSQFDRDLRESLRRREPPPGFAEKVLSMSRTSRESETRHTARPWLAAAAAVVLMIGGGIFIEQQRQQAEDEKAKEQAKEQLMVALRITGSKLRNVQERLSTIQQRAGQRQSNP